MKFILSIILSLCSVLGFSQTILYQTENTSRTVQDPQTVILTEGFHAKSDVSNPFIAKIGPSTGNPGGGPVDSGAGAGNPSGTTAPPGQSFHDTAGNIEVNGGGQLQFTLAITLPPGVKNIAPNMNLTYTSNSGNGAMGYGWSISGVTAISRMGKTIERDGEQIGVKLDNSDYYTFNGQRLILKSGEYGKNGAEYVTEKYSNIKIKSFGAITAQPWQGPEYWIVTFEDGSQAWYGDPPATSYNASTTPLEYNISKWKDAQGNYILYDYMQGQGNSQNLATIDRIRWGGNENLNTSPVNIIIFNYVPNTLSESYYIAGVPFVQDRILDNVIVAKNNDIFKKYTIEYGSNSTNYQFVNKITESNSQGASANSIKFEYPQATPISIEYNYIQSADPFSGVKLTGDFNGDSYIDFVMDNGTIKLGAFNNDTFTTFTTNKVFASNAKVVNTLLDEEGEVYNGNGVVEYKDGKVLGYIYRNNTFVKVFERNMLLGSSDDMITLEVGDLDGDGISDLFIDDGDQGAFNTKVVVDLKYPSTGFYYILPLTDENSYTDQKYMDIDGDGKVEVINVQGSQYTVFEFVKYSSNQYLKKIRFSGSLMETKDSEFPVLFGDFNGDGKLDFTIPVTDNAIGKPDNWRFYIGTGKGFNNFLKTEFFTYRKPKTTPGNGYTISAQQYFFSIADMNKDGKSDIVQIFSYNQVNNFSAQGYRDFGYVVSTKLANGAGSGGTLNFAATPSFVSPTYQVQNIDDLTLFAPLTSPIKANNNYYNVFLYWKQYLHRLKAPTPIAELARIKSINQGNDRVITDISYAEATPESNNIYNKTKKEFYPYFSSERANQTFLVSQLRQAGRKQDFRYRGFTGNLHGKGMIGFNQVARSSFYADGFENTKIWSGLEIDIENEGVPVKEWSIRTNNENQIFPPDISENNTQLLSFKSTLYQTDKLINGQVVTNVANADKPKVVIARVPQTITEKDFLTGTNSVSEITYGNYYLPSHSLTNINNGYSITTSEFEYVHNPSADGADYYIGRPTSKTDVSKAYGDVKFAKEEYSYENNLLKTIIKWNRDNSENTIETNGYDDFGNVIKKEIRNSLDSQVQTVSTEYDSQGFFVLKQVDNLGLETEFTYNGFGQVLTQTTPLGNIQTNTYDDWGKLLKSKNNLTGTTTYQYDRNSNFNITVTQYDSDGDVTKKFTNKLGQKYKVSTKAFGQGQFVSKDFQYDALGRTIKESEPYFEGQNASQWNTSTYDDSVFPTKVSVVAFNGKQVETSVTGLTTIVKQPNNYNKITSKTADALGNIVSSTDQGGMIQFSYNAAGEQIEAKYAGNIVKTQYDAWGRKSEFNDPSNGVYKYEYDGFGQSKKIFSPKGTKEYKYNALGQLITQSEVSTVDGGQATNKTINYTYDDKGRVVSKSGTSKGKAYSSNVVYDPQGRVLSSSESSNGKYFIKKGITYDDKGKIVSYEKQLYSSGTLTNVQIENVYSSWDGQLYQVKDKVTGKVLWELQGTNARGQVVNAKLGMSIINNDYNNDTGLLREIKHTTSPSQTILNIKYTFDAVKNELKLRTTLGDFNLIESFDYDDNNRLVSWTNPRTGQVSSNTYDVKGRIIENDQVGAIKFDNSSKIYQATGMTLNAAGTQNYNNDLIQSITYNENNDPVFIDGEKGDVAFQYGLTNMRQRVTYGGNFGADNDGKFTKFYNEDGSFEISKDNTTGKEKHIIYIGGTPYESNIIYLKNFDESSGSFKFLHKDYLGSILAISDETGNKLEQRHFDAWGNFTHLKIGGGAIITDKNTIDNTSLLVDRGYTSHEHFAEIGIIHMNGRLYDPLLRRFLNADENIQDIFNTQIYNKYGYVTNNPLMYTDPDGEFAWIIIGAVAGAWITGAKANGTWNPMKWNWGNTWGKIVMGAAIGAVTGGIGSAVGVSALAAIPASWGISGGILGGAISGAAGGAVAGALNGFTTAVMFGENVLEGTLMGAGSGFVAGGVLGGVLGGAQQAINNAKGIGTPGTILKGAPIAEGRSAWTLNNVSKTTTTGATPKGSLTNTVIVGEASGDFEVGKSLATEVPGEAIYKADTNLAKVPQEEILVRHHTSYKNLKLIKKSGFLNASRAEPFGVDVEVAPFVNPTKADLSQWGRGSYIEFYAPKSQLGVPPGYLKGGNGNPGRIFTDGLKPFDLKGTDPKFVRWNWLGF
ncbi:RHS repeat-associated core domain-containing protein [Chryseobacterium glaciei]|nr:RHS repeat-associated core domain-containing protein [Chryseobacterium glaciei]